MHPNKKRGQTSISLIAFAPINDGNKVVVYLDHAHKTQRTQREIDLKIPLQLIFEQ